MVRFITSVVLEDPGPRGSLLRFRVKWDGSRRVVSVNVGYRVDPSGWSPATCRCRRGTAHGPRRVPAWEINAAVDAGLSLAEASERVDRELPEQGHAYRVYQERFPMTVSGPVPGTEDVIDELLAAGVPTFGLSNWAAENFSVAREAAPGIGRLADVIVSGEVGLAKPDEAIFRLALERFGL